MIECASCHTLNPDKGRTCLACGRALGSTPATGPATGVKCVAGHTIAPDWNECPYCKRNAEAAAAEAGAPGAPGYGAPGYGAPGYAAPGYAAPGYGAPGGTRIDFGQAATTPLGAARRPPAAPPRYSLEPPAPTRLETPGGAGRTVLQETPPRRPSGGGEPASVAGGAAGGRQLSRLVAALAAPDLGEGGAIFPVRAGKTTIGADRRSDVPLAGDPRVSSEHAVLLYRDGVFHLSDRLSTNGTWINGLEVPANGTVTLRDRDQLLLGDTRLIFLIVAGAHSPAAGAP